MKVITTSIVLLVLCALPALPQKKGTSKNRKASSVSLTAREIARRSLPSVVVLIARDANDNAGTLGSGFFVTPRIVATNLHVIENASRVTAKLLNGNKTEYEIKGTVAIDEDNDIVLLQVETGVEPDLERYLDPLAKPLPLAKDDLAQTGDEVYVVGNPEGLVGTFSQGIISAFRGTDYIQITAPISPGSSGGPVINRYGEVIGVATAFIKEGQNLNFAIPVAKLFRLLANRSGPKPIRPRINLAFDGLYGATFKSNNGDLVQWFRFYPDGSVFATWANPRDNVSVVYDGLTDRGNQYAYYGRYELKGSDIEFVLNHGGYRDSGYRGTASLTRLRLTERTIAGAEFTNEYGFV